MQVVSASLEAFIACVAACPAAFDSGLDRVLSGVFARTADQKDSVRVLAAEALAGGAPWHASMPGIMGCVLAHLLLSASTLHMHTARVLGSYSGLPS